MAAENELSKAKMLCFLNLKKLLAISILACCCVSLLNLLCFNGECSISEEENKALSSLSDVVRQANKISSIDSKTEILTTAKENIQGIVAEVA